MFTEFRIGSWGFCSCSCYAVVVAAVVAAAVVAAVVAPSVVAAAVVAAVVAAAVVAPSAVVPPSAVVDPAAVVEESAAVVDESAAVVAMVVGALVVGFMMFWRSVRKLRKPAPRPCRSLPSPSSSAHSVILTNWIMDVILLKPPQKTGRSFTVSLLYVS